MPCYTKPLRVNGRSLCVHCRVDITQRWSYSLRCLPCNHSRSRLREPIKQAAHRAVFLAVRDGALAPVRSLTCVDCGAPATDYDHRDYSKPLEVDPTCRGCNLRRGAGAGLPDLPLSQPEAA